MTQNIADLITTDPGYDCGQIQDDDHLLKCKCETCITKRRRQYIIKLWTTEIGVRQRRILIFLLEANKNRTLQNGY